MYDFTRTSPFDEQQIETLRQRLTRMDRAALIRFYNSSLHMCMLHQDKPPRAPYMQQLVQAWKEMAKREQISAGLEQGATLPALPGIDKEPQKRPQASSTLPLFPAGNLDSPNPVDIPSQ